MTPEQRRQLDELCKRVATETDPKRFSELIKQLNDLLDENSRRFAEEAKADPLLRPPKPR